MVQSCIIQRVRAGFVSTTSACSTSRERAKIQVVVKAKSSSFASGVSCSTSARKSVQTVKSNALKWESRRRWASRVVASSSQNQEQGTSIGEDLGVLSLRLGVSLMMFHNGLDKLADPEGFSTFVVAKYLSFLPAPLLWTYAAAGAELVCPVLLAFGLLARPSAFALFSTMCFAILFHLNDTGLEGFPLAVVEKHQYAFETSALYAGIFLYFVLAGPGKLSLGGKK